MLTPHHRKIAIVQKKPETNLITPEILRDLGLTVSKITPKTQVSDVGNPHQINIPMSVQTSTIKYSAPQDGIAQTGPNAIVVTSPETVWLGLGFFYVVGTLLEAISEAGIPVYTIYKNVKNSNLYDVAQIESKFSELGFPIDTIKQLDVVELRRLIIRWRALRDRYPHIQSIPGTFVQPGWIGSREDRIDTSSPLLTLEPLELAKIITQVSELELTIAQYKTHRAILDLNPGLTLTLTVKTIEDLHQFYQTYPHETRIKQVSLTGSEDPIWGTDKCSGSPFKIRTAPAPVLTIEGIQRLSDQYPEIQVIDTPVLVRANQWDLPVISRLTQIQIEGESINVNDLQSWLNRAPHLTQLSLVACTYRIDTDAHRPISHPNLAHLHFKGTPSSALIRLMPTVTELSISDTVSDPNLSDIWPVGGNTKDPFSKPFDHIRTLTLTRIQFSKQSQFGNTAMDSRFPKVTTLTIEACKNILKDGYRGGTPHLSRLIESLTLIGESLPAHGIVALINDYDSGAGRPPKLVYLDISRYQVTFDPPTLISFNSWKKILDCASSKSLEALILNSNMFDDGTDLKDVANQLTKTLPHCVGLKIIDAPSLPRFASQLPPDQNEWRFSESIGHVSGRIPLVTQMPTDQNESRFSESSDLVSGRIPLVNQMPPDQNEWHFSESTGRVSGRTTFIAPDGTPRWLGAERKTFFNLDPDTYNQFTTVAVQADEFKSVLVKKTNLRDLVNLAKAEDGRVLGKIELVSNTDQIALLPTFGPTDQIIGYTTHNNQTVQLGIIDHLGTWGAKFDKLAVTTTLYYVLQMGTDPDTEIEFNESVALDDSKFQGIPLNRKIPIFETLRSLETRRDRFNQIKSFCSEFDSTQKLIPSDDPSLDDRPILKALLDRCIAPRGVCTDRTRVFLFLASLCGINALGIGNDIHEFVQVKTKNGNWIPIDLGGGTAATTDITAPDLNDFSTPQSEPAAIQESPKKSTTDSVQSAPTLDLSTQKRAIALPEKDHAKAVQWIRNRSAIPVFYVASLSDLDGLMHRPSLDASGQPFRRPGPILDCLTQQTPFHVILNLNGFESRDFAKINSMFEPQAALAGYPVHPDSKTTVFVQKADQFGSDITTRIGSPRQGYRFPDLKQGRVILTPKSPPHSQIEYPIDFSNPDWKTQLFGGLGIGPNGFEMRPGLINDPHPVTLFVGPSMPPELTVEMARLNETDGATITLVTQLWPQTITNQLTQLATRIQTVDPTWADSSICDIANTEIIAQWRSGVLIRDGRLVRRPTDLSQVRQLYITRSLSQSDWVWLAQTLPTNAQVGLAKGVTIPPDIKSIFGIIPTIESSNRVVMPSSYVVVTQDPLVTAQRTGSRIIAFDTNATSSEELFHLNPNLDRWSFSPKSTELLTILTTTSDPIVVLGLTPQSPLWETLEPLFFGFSFIMVNGDKIPVSAPIIAVIANEMGYMVTELPRVETDNLPTDPPVLRRFQYSGPDDLINQLQSNGILMISGPTGTGKSTTFKHLDPAKVHIMTESEWDQFLGQTNPSRYTIMVLDNCHDQRFEIIQRLQGLFQRHPTIQYKGTSHSIDFKQKGILLIGDHTRLTKESNAILSSVPVGSLPTHLVTPPRGYTQDLRFQQRVENAISAFNNTPSYRAFWHKVLEAGVHYEPLARLTNALRQQGIWLCNSNQNIYQQVDRFIQLRAIKSGLSEMGYLGKNGMILMGQSGLGKSTAFRSVLVASGYQPLNPNQRPVTDTSLYFYQITAQNRDMANAILERALRHGIPVIVDEFNLIDSSLFKPYLDGQFPTSSRYTQGDAKPGFVLLLTGNPPETYRGRSPVTPTLIDQTVSVVWTKPYTRLDFDHILATALNGTQDPELTKLIDAYLTSANQNRLVNSRPIFEKITALTQPRSTDSECDGASDTLR